MPFTMSAIDVGLVHAMGAEGYGKATCFHFFDHSHGYVAARSDRLKFRNVGNSSGAPLRAWPMSRLTQWAGRGPWPLWLPPQQLWQSGRSLCDSAFRIRKALLPYLVPEHFH